MPSDDPVSALDIVTLVVAGIGALTGIAALAWQAATFALSGGRAKVTLKVAWLSPGGGALVGEPGTWHPGRRPAEGFDLECFGVEVVNVGRLPITVTGWGVDIGKAQLGYVLAAWNPPLPHRLDVGEQATWFVEAPSVAAAASALAEVVGGNPSVRLRANAKLGTGKSVTSKNSMTLTP